MRGAGWLLKVAVASLVVAVVVAGLHTWARSSDPSAPPATVAALKGLRQSVVPAKVQPNSLGKVQATPIRKGYWYAFGPNHTRRVVLSFDDCPRSVKAYRAVLSGAEKLGIGLMLFPTGTCLSHGRFSAAYARAHGHYVFNHSISHPELTRLSYAGVLHQLSKPGVQARYGRPPYGAYNATVSRAYRAKGMKIWTWSVDTNDWRGYSRAVVVNRVVRWASAGSTVLMHMQWNAFSVKALRQIKDGLAKRGLSVCRNYPGTTPVRSWTVRC